MIAAKLSFLLCLLPAAALALDICLPTGNDALLRPGSDADFFQPTVEGTVESGMFGCVRRDGRKFHEGLDIKCLQRDRRGEPTDPVHAVAAGTVAFINNKPGLSNYGRYIVLEHRWDGVQVFTLYAHLRAIADVLATGQPVQKGQAIATLGRSTNTREGISRDRAHLHFEINFMLNPNFHVWYPKRDPKAPPFGNFNGLNFIGLDPAAFFRAYAADRQLNFAAYISRLPVAFTVLFGAKPLPWMELHPEQVQSRAAAAAYEVGFTAWGLPVVVWPRAEAPAGRLPALHRVSETELARNGCRGLVRQRGNRWELTEAGREWIELINYAP
jgi:hypothetical protein